MLCGYETTCMQSECSEKRCTTCQASCRNGMMILVGIIAGLVFAAIVVLLFINGFLPNPFPVVLSILIAGLTALFGVPTAAFILEDGSAKKQCLRCHFGGLFFGIIGTVLAAALTTAAELKVSCLCHFAPLTASNGQTNSMLYGRRYSFPMGENISFLLCDGTVKFLKRMRIILIKKIRAAAVWYNED